MYFNGIWVFFGTYSKNIPKIPKGLREFSGAGWTVGAGNGQPIRG